MTGVHEPWSEKWRRFLLRPHEDRQLILRAALIFPLTEIGLRVFGFQRWEELVERFFFSAHAAQPLPTDLLREEAMRIVCDVRSCNTAGGTTP